MKMFLHSRNGLFKWGLSVNQSKQRPDDDANQRKISKGVLFLKEYDHPVTS